MSWGTVWDGWSAMDWVTWVVICLAAGFARGYLVDRWHRRSEEDR